MPRATADLMTVSDELPLKTCPPDGWVKLRSLSYGQILERRAMVAGMKVRSEQGQRGFEGELQTINNRVTLYDFQHCIADHNLEDAEGRKLNLQNLNDINSLDPKIGQEIEMFMDERNNFEPDQGNLQDGSSSTSEVPSTADQMTTFDSL